MKDHPAPDGQKDDFNEVATRTKRRDGFDQVEVDEWVVTFWLNRAISKYCAVYASGDAHHGRVVSLGRA